MWWNKQKIKTCVTCRWHKKEEGEHYCMASVEIVINLVDGVAARTKPSTCRLMRKISLCGPKGKKWEHEQS